MLKRVSELTEEEVTTLEDAYKNHPTARVRNRAHAIILSHKGYALKEIADICGTTRQAVSRLINRWEASGLRGLYDKFRPGKPRSLTPEDEDFIHKMVEEEPRSIKKIMICLEDQRGKKVSKATVARVIKKRRRWKRIRKSLKGKRNEAEFRKSQQAIKELELRREKGEIDVQYFDGAGFNETPCVPYAYQPKNEYIEITPSKGKSISALAFMNKDNDCTPFMFDCRVDTDVVISCFESFIKEITKETYIIMDNAPVHKSKKFLSHLPEWEKKNLKIVFLSKYSPELNLIEILWRKMKYEWLPFEAYASFQALTEWIEEIFVNFGSQYVIEFS